MHCIPRSESQAFDRGAAPLLLCMYKFIGGLDLNW